MQGASTQKRDSSGGGRKASKDPKQTKDKETKDAKVDPKDSKHTKDSKNSKTAKDTKESKEHKQSKGGKDLAKEIKHSKDSKKESNKHSDTVVKYSEDVGHNAKESKLSVTGQDSPSRKEKVQSKVCFPLTRIKMIMKSAPEVNTLGVDAVALTARAAELFVVHLAKETLKKGKADVVDYEDIYKVVHDNPVLDFLYDIIPQKVAYKDCIEEMKEMDRKQKEIMDQIEI